MTTEHMEELNDQQIVRREKMAALREQGIDPFGKRFERTADSGQLKEKYSELDKEQLHDLNETAIIAGRLVTKRGKGKVGFAHLQDREGQIQIYVRKDAVGEENYEIFKKADLGDFLGVEGEVMRTDMGELSIKATHITHLSKALRPLPEKFHGLSDVETIYRKRYLDLISNRESFNRFVTRSKIISEIRRYLDGQGFLEVETPVLHNEAGGASARPFITHHNALDIPLYMRIANELYLKRLIVGGFDGVYEFSKNFRNEGMDRTHNPEFTAMEIYVAYKDYHWMMDFTERLLEHCAIAVNGTTKATFGAHTVDFKAPYPRVTMTDAIKQFTGFDITGKTEEELRVFAHSIGIAVDETMGKGKLIDEIFGEKCEGNFIQPTFITDYPKEMSPLTKEHRDNPDLTERFELMVCGKEIANAYSELNDPIDQRERFEEQLRLSEKGDDEAMFIDQDFLRALEYGMPPTSGLGIGMDRLIMFLTNNESIQEVLFFPQMRPEKKGVELSEDEKVIFELLKTSEKLLLDALKEQAALSNKKWDKAIKGLTSKKVAKVAKEGEELFVELAK